MKKEVYAKIEGVVQGVNFRYETLRKANSLGLTGWVKNTPDGGVETVAQGEEAELNEFLSWCKKGPSNANVKNINVTWRALKEELTSFSIEY